MLNCTSCKQPIKRSAPYPCGHCHESVCKSCVQIVDPSTFAFLSQIPAALSGSTYCSACYGQIVAPAHDAYLETMERAKNIFVFFKTQRQSLPILKRSKEVLKVVDCRDRDETILRLAFQAAERSFNGLLDTEVESQKVKEGRYQHYIWRGTGSPVQVDEVKLERQHQQELIYR